MPMTPHASNTRLIRMLINLFLARFSPSDIEKATRHPLRIGLCGDRDTIEDFRAMLVEGTVARDAPFPSLSLHPLPADDPAHLWSLIDDCQFVMVLLQREHLLGDTIHRVHEALPKKVSAIWAALGHAEPWLRYEVSEIARELNLARFHWVENFAPDGVGELLRDIIKHAGGYDLSLARKLPLLRPQVAARLIRRTSRQNLMIAMASALPASIPWIGPIIGILGVTGEVIVLTSNQLKMALQLASIYDLEMNLPERLTELAPIVGTAFGWRALARELVGFVPVAGPGVKGSIAYAGTTAVGEAAHWYYRTGRQMSAADHRRVFDEALEHARDLAAKLGAWLPGLGDRGRAEFEKSLTSDRPALPPWLEDDAAPAPSLSSEEAARLARFRINSRQDEQEWPRTAADAEPTSSEDREQA